jgi:hypothetical protein
VIIEAALDCERRHDAILASWATQCPDTQMEKMMKKLALALAALSLLATVIPSSAQNRICTRSCNPQGTYCTTTCY